MVHMKTNGRRRILRSVVTVGGRRCWFGRFLRATVFSSVRWVRAAIKPTIRFKNCITHYQSNLKTVSSWPKNRQNRLNVLTARRAQGRIK